MTKTSYPCVLLLNDMHISKDTITEFTTNWNEALSVCDKLTIKIMALGGDLFQSRSAQTLDVLLAVHDMLIEAEKRNITIILANGNHCKVNPESIRGYCHVFDQHNNVIVIDHYKTISSISWDFVLHIMAYFPENGSFMDKLNEVKSIGLKDDKCNYLYVHQGINGALSKSSENELPTHIFSEFDKVFAGHYHNRCVIPGTNIEYIGASRQHNFGEDEEKGYTVLYSDGSHEFIKNQVNTRFKVIDVPVEKANIHLLDQLEEIKAEGKYRVKVRVHSSNAKASTIDKSSILNAGASKVEVINEEHQMLTAASSSLFEKFDAHKIIDNYQDFCKEKNIQDVSLGLQYLSKIESNHVDIN